MSANVFVPLSEVQSLTAHDFDLNPLTAVQGALLDVARYGVGLLCEIGPEIAEEDLDSIALWAERHSGDEHEDGLLNGMADEINSRADMFTDSIKKLFSALGNCTTSGLTVIKWSLREREHKKLPDWHKDGTATASGIRVILPILPVGDSSQSLFLASRNIYDYDPSDEEWTRFIYNKLNSMPTDEHISLTYRPRTAVLMAEGPFEVGMKVVYNEGDVIYGVESPMHAGWCDPSNLATRQMLVVDGMLKKQRARITPLKLHFLQNSYVL